MSKKLMQYTLSVYLSFCLFVSVDSLFSVVDMLEKNSNLTSSLTGLRQIWPQHIFLLYWEGKKEVHEHFKLLFKYV